VHEVATTEQLRVTIARLALSSTALAAIGNAIAARADLAPIDPRAADVLRALDLSDAIDALTAIEVRSILGDIRTVVAHEHCSVLSHASGWSFTDDVSLTAAGEVSVGFAHLLKTVIAPKLEGLSARLESGGAFLDVGVGVAAMSIELSRLYPRLRIVGIDPWEPSLAIARSRIDPSRIELRDQSIEDLRDEDAFDLIWIPSVFIPEHAIAQSLGRVRTALRPHGWLLFAVARPGDDPLTAAIVRFRTASFGGTLFGPEGAAKLLEADGFRDVRVLPSPPGSTIALVAARARKM